MSEQYTYLSISNSSEAIYKEKSSRFIALAFPVSDEKDIKELLKKIKNKYHDANHFCYAYRLGYDGKIMHTGDGGEPSGTAGKPILGQLLSKNLTNILIVVIRYFGGIKLGINGLINAYRQSTAEVLNKSVIVEKFIEETYTISFKAENINNVMKLLKDFDAEIIENKYTDRCSIKFSIRMSQKEKLISMLSALNSRGIIDFAV
jgi:uncharacterized YigZ family protein